MPKPTPFTHSGLPRAPVEAALTGAATTLSAALADLGATEPDLLVFVAYARRAKPGTFDVQAASHGDARHELNLAYSIIRRRRADACANMAEPLDRAIAALEELALPPEPAARQ